MSITLLAMARTAVYAALFSVLIVMSSTFFPFIGGKYYFFRAAVELGVIFLLLWWAFEARAGVLEAKLRKIFREPIVVAVSLFAFMFLLASLFAYDAYGAFWSNYERGEGGFQMLHYYAFFLLLVILFDKEDEWRYIFKLSLVAALGMILYGIAAASFREGFVGPYGQTGGSTLLARLFQKDARFQGSLGNPAYVAPYLLFSMFYVGYLWLSRKAKAAPWRRIAWYSGLLVFFLVFFVQSQTRGAFLGLAAGVGVALLYLVLHDRRLRKPALGLAAILLALWGGLYANRENPAIQAIPGSRFLTINIAERTAETRFWTWGSARAGFAERPIFGWGPENFSTVFDKYFDPRHFIPGANTETWFDRAHSVFFDYLAETGILGFLSYLGMFVVFFWQFKKRLVASAGHGSLFGHGPVVDALFLAMPVGYLVQGLVLFDVLPIYLNLFFFLAFANFLFARHEPKP